MFTAEQIENFKIHLYSIRDELLLNKKEAADEVWWPTPYYINADQYAFEESYDIFNGNCGIVLFFLELYRFDQDMEHLHLIDQVMHRIYKSEAIAKPNFFAFYTGLGGVIYTSIRIFEATDNEKYKNKALELALRNQKSLTEELLKADFLSGYTGNLIVLTLLYHHTGNDEVLTMIKLLIERLIAEARVSVKGLKWDYSRSKKAYDSMTGFSHGASGIAYALIQLYQYFNASGLLYLAEEAFEYEMQYFYEPAQNWLDLRIGQHNLSKPHAHKWELGTFVSDMANVNAWAHGAAGIGLARQAAFHFTQKDIYLKHCGYALNRCLEDIKKYERPDFTLVSGYLGMIPFLLKCNGHYEGPFTNEITSVIDQAISQHQKTKSYNGYVSCGLEDYGLFSGKSGVGYILLYLLMNDGSNNVIAPQLPDKNKRPSLKDIYTMQAVQYQIFSKYYGRTIQKIEEIHKPFRFEPNIQNIDIFKRTLEMEILSCKKLEIRKLFDLESEMLTLWKQHKGYFSYQQKNIYINKRAEEANLKSDEDLLGMVLRFCNHIKYYEFNEDGNYLLLICNENGVRELKIGILPAVVLKAIIDKPLKISNISDCIVDIYAKDRLDQKRIETFRTKIMHQIRLLIKSGFVEVV